MYIYIRAYVYIYICVIIFCICIYVYMYICIYVYMYICIYVYVYTCIYVYMYICIYVYMYICICKYIYICVQICMWQGPLGSISFVGLERKVIISFTCRISIGLGKHPAVSACDCFGRICLFGQTCSQGSPTHLFAPLGEALGVKEQRTFNHRDCHTVLCFLLSSYGPRNFR